MPAFNLSHSGEIAVCAFDDEKLQRLERVGVDVQEIREIGEGIIERFYSEAEYQEAIQGEKRIASEIWSKKESLGKCRGYGLHGNLKELDTTVCKELFYVYMLSGNKETVIEEQGALGRLQGEYVLTVCTDSPCQVEMYQVSWRE